VKALRLLVPRGLLEAAGRPGHRHMVEQDRIAVLRGDQCHEGRIIGVVYDEKSLARSIQCHLVDPLRASCVDHVDDLHAPDVDDLQRAIAVAGVKGITIRDYSVRTARIIVSGEAYEAADAPDELVGSRVENVDALV